MDHLLTVTLEDPDSHKRVFNPVLQVPYFCLCNTHTGAFRATSCVWKLSGKIALTSEPVVLLGMFFVLSLSDKHDRSSATFLQANN